MELKVRSIFKGVDSGEPTAAIQKQRRQKDSATHCINFLATIIWMKGRKRCKKPASQMMGPAGQMMRQWLLGKRDVLVWLGTVVMTQRVLPIILSMKVSAQTWEIRARILGTWNVQGMNAGKMEIITTRMGEQCINVIGEAETWWLNQGRFITNDGYTVVYSGKDEGKGNMELVSSWIKLQQSLSCASIQ